ncbi:MAG: hypothetical protein CVU39_10160 [Chloroflexi bacterium HGW-Chloroflexi-10]|nr:MAG: hypothetical protein CVU39_10160 [Chloroflexi bacterium HGW-Chloroflexi-10]
MDSCGTNEDGNDCLVYRKQTLFLRSLEAINAKFKRTNDVKAMVQTIEAAVRYYNGNNDAMMMTLNDVFLGTPTLGPSSMWDAHKYGEDTGYEDGGFDNYSVDNSNQVRHFWAALANSTFRTNFLEENAQYGIYSIVLVVLYTQGAAAHEIQPFFDSDPETIGSYKDFYLSAIGNEIGMRISIGVIQPNDLANIINVAISPNPIFIYSYSIKLGY